MRDDETDDRDKITPAECDAGAERDREREAAQQRGRERMLAIWRAAVQSVTEAARREAARAADAAGEQARAADQEPAPPTWVFPPKVRGAA